MLFPPNGWQESADSFVRCRHVLLFLPLLRCHLDSFFVLASIGKLGLPTFDMTIQALPANPTSILNGHQRIVLIAGPQERRSNFLWHIGVLFIALDLVFHWVKHHSD